MRAEVISLVENYLRENSNAFFMTADLGYGALESIQLNYPLQFINAGISEANMILTATGLALSGNKVIVYSIGNFITLRVIEHIRNSICYHEADVMIIAIGAGFSYGQLGFTHHMTEDIAIMRSIPNLKIFSPADSQEAIAVTKLALKSKTPTYIRLSKFSSQIHKYSFELNFERGIEVFSGDEVCIFSTGEILLEAIDAIAHFKSKGINIGLISFPIIKPLPKQFIYELINKYKVILTIEEGNLNGGFGSAINDIASNHISSTQIYRMGIDDQFANVVGDTAYLRKLFKISSENIVYKISEIIGVN